MREVEDEECYGGGASVFALAARNQPHPATTSPPISFDRRELNQILRVYGRKVADGEWRDYAIDHLKDRAVFSVFRRTSEVPMFRIEKHPKLSRRQGAFSVTAASGLIVKRGQDLAQVLRIFDKALRVVKG